MVQAFRCPLVSSFGFLSSKLEAFTQEHGPAWMKMHPASRAGCSRPGSRVSVCESLQIDGGRCRPGDGGDEAAVAPKVQAGGLVLLQRRGLVALADAERPVRLAVPDHRLLVAVVGQGLHSVRGLRGRETDTSLGALQGCGAHTHGAAGCALKLLSVIHCSFNS